VLTLDDEHGGETKDLPPIIFQQIERYEAERA